MELARRSFITGLIALVAAPAIVRAGSLMPVKQMVWSSDQLAQLLDARLDVYTDAVPVTGLYQRYAGYEPIQFDPERHAWKNADEIRRERKVQDRFDLDRLLNG